MAVASNTLFRFVKDFDILKDILSNDGFSVKYSKELLSFNKKKKPLTIIVPMVCFCDIPLTLTKEHIDKYGGYAIGMTKKWGIKTKLNPVLYIVKDSELAVNLSGTLGSNKMIDTNPAYVISFIKTYTSIYRNDTVDNSVINYIEREWRFVPSEKQLSDLKIDKPVFRFSDEKHRATLNEKVAKIRVEFKSEDVKYIILQNNEEILQMKEHLKTLGKDAEYQNIPYFTVTNIQEDF